jgi:short-subunit dehydrogenase
MRTAVIVGASSGIGEALARELHRAGWRLALLARRLDRLETIRQSLSAETTVHGFDVTQADAGATFGQVLEKIGGADLVIISAGAGHNNLELRPDLDAETVSVNVLGFMAIARSAMRHFMKRGKGHLVGISSVAALRGNRAAAYAASKAFQSVYLDGVRDLAKHKGLPITVTEVQPGAVDTDMLKPERPFPSIIRKLLVVTPAKAARQIFQAIDQQKSHAYITKRYALIALVLKLLR